MRLFLLLLVLVLTVFSTACTIGPGRSEAPALHMLEWSGEFDGAGSVIGESIHVASPVAYPGYDAARIAYRQSGENGGHELRHYGRNSWVEKPARMMGAAITEAIAESGLFREVAAPGRRLTGPFYLHTDLIRLEQVFEDESSHVRFTVRYRLLDQRTGESLGSLRQDLRVAPDTNDPSGGVAAANQALSQSLAELVNALPQWLEQ